MHEGVNRNRRQATEKEIFQVEIDMVFSGSTLRAEPEITISILT